MSRSSDKIRKLHVPATSQRHCFDDDLIWLSILQLLIFLIVKHYKVFFWSLHCCSCFYRLTRYSIRT
ncbi:hypothetical protein ASPWEDRAFT_440978 [Aspergillus wentii DTO 134E9]|uniref:Uncharacterized protein n=1 Tax=Aspergillus wentii DTO 134E9 TaxID=1073089 RepID=A0A1L9RQN8_ASPWE|nr:uncharacterized protein ASPWEDRAFT_440978 [Aspergillus wentii DTO 134E9]OJJ37138.1 hypothetical protein ASPWEDRAFT_440978 [Aspergillus wentii DTO 134E9]